MKKLTKRTPTKKARASKKKAPKKKAKPKITSAQLAKIAVSTRDARTISAEFRRRAADLRKRTQKAKAAGRSMCAASRGRLVEAIAEARAHEKSQLDRWMEEQRRAVRHKCKARRELISMLAKTEAERLRKDRVAVAEERAHLRSIQQQAKSAKRIAAGLKGATARAESDEQVANNIPGELLPIWEKVRRRPAFSRKRNASRSRTEAFLEYVEENREAIARELAKGIEAKLDKMEVSQSACLKAADHVQTKVENSGGRPVKIASWAWDQLNLCQKEFEDPRWDPGQLEAFYRDLSVGEAAPF